MRYFSFLILLLISCGSSLESTNIISLPGNSLPEKWGEDFKISYYDGGGMVYYSMNIDFSYDSCRVKEDIEGNELYFAFAMTESLRQEMLDFFKKQNVLSIRSNQNQGIVYDKGTSSITIQMGTTVISISESASSNIIAKDQVRFGECYRYLHTQAIKGLAPQKKKLTVNVSSKIINLNKTINFGINSTGVHYYNDQGVAIPKKHDFTILPGKYKFNFYMTERKEDGTTVYLGNLYENIEILNDTEIELDYKNGKLELKLN